jgi:hypothetical protein
MKSLTETSLLLLLVLVSSACGTVAQSDLGGTEAGNPPLPSTRNLQGSVPASEDDTTLLRAATANGCAADSVIATDTDDAATTTAEVAEDCSFVLSLEVEKAYAIEFSLDGTVIGALSFNVGGDAFPSSFLFVTAGDSAIDLGVITFNGTVATATENPADQTDLDGDSINDSSDTDDNNDNSSDDDEQDCDLDGIRDLYDTDISSCQDTTASQLNLVPVLEVSPRSNAGLVGSLLGVGLTEAVKARVSCALDPTTITASTFSVVDTQGHAISCIYNLSSDGKIVTCTHTDNSFAMLTTYTATLQGLACTDGSLIETTSWSWKTVLSLF